MLSQVQGNDNLLKSATLKFVDADGLLASGNQHIRLQAAGAGLKASPEGLENRFKAFRHQQRAYSDFCNDILAVCKELVIRVLVDREEQDGSLLLQEREELAGMKKPDLETASQKDVRLWNRKVRDLREARRKELLEDPSIMMGSPVVVMGHFVPRAGGGRKQGALGASIRRLRDTLAANFLVIMMKEDYSSQVSCR